MRHPVDPSRPAVVFTGESVVFGEGLTWDESVPGQVEAGLATPAAVLAVHGFGNDQAYLRLEAELPRFEHPVAVVTLFTTTLFGRNLDHRRPHLGPGLAWQAGVPEWRLQTLARLIVPYHSDAVIDEGVEVTREVLRATARLARAHGAAPLVIVPQFGPEDEAQRALAPTRGRRERRALCLRRDGFVLARAVEPPSRRAGRAGHGGGHHRAAAPGHRGGFRISGQFRRSWWYCSW